MSFDFSFCIMFDIPEFLQVLDREFYSRGHENQAQVHNNKNFPIMLCTAELKWWGKERESIMKTNEKLCSELMDILFIFVTRSWFPPLGCKAIQIYIRVSWREHLFPALLWWELCFPGEHNDKMCLQTPQTQVRQGAKAPEKNPLISKLIWLNLPFL